MSQANQRSTVTERHLAWICWLGAGQNFRGTIVIGKHSVLNTNHRNQRRATVLRVGYKTILRADPALRCFGLYPTCDILAFCDTLEIRSTKICQINLLGTRGSLGAVVKQFGFKTTSKRLKVLRSSAVRPIWETAIAITSRTYVCAVKNVYKYRYWVHPYLTVQNTYTICSTNTKQTVASSAFCSCRKAW